MSGRRLEGALLGVQDERMGDPITVRQLEAAPSGGRKATRLEGGDRYERGELLGAGAMGSVHLCRDRHIGRHVAIKMMVREYATDRLAQLRFEREARLQGQLEHPAIVPVHDLGVTADGRLFFTMKRVQGSSLRDILAGLLARDPEFVSHYGPRRLLSAFGTVCLAIAFAHSKGVLHRDIKPGNIMIGDFGEVYVLDWGIAKLKADRGQAKEDIHEIHDEVRVDVEIVGEIDMNTRAGEMVGTVGYMAPEQIRGEVLDERADVYALGATLFELLTLTPLHPRDNDGAISSTLTGGNDHISELARLKGVAPELEELCIRATAIDRAERPASVREMYDIIERVLDGDRDLERQRVLAAEHAARAREEAHRALVGGADAKEARSRAIREVHRALALDPTDKGALEILTRLALAPTAETSSHADRVMVESSRHLRRRLANMGIVLLTPLALGTTLVVMLGIRNVTHCLITLATLIAVAVFAWFRRHSDGLWATLTALCATDLLVALTSGPFGPFILVPGLLACVTVIFTSGTLPGTAMTRSTPDSSFRYIAMAASILAFLAPIALELTGMVPPSIAFREGEIVILARTVDFPPQMTLIALVLVNIPLILVPAIIATGVRDHGMQLERRAIASASHLRELLPWETQAVIPRQSAPTKSEPPIT